MSHLFPLMKRTVLALTLICTFTHLNAQSWLELREQGANFYDIKAAFERQYASKMTEFNRELRQEAARTGQRTSKYEKELEGMIQYKRWAHFVEPRVRESNGDMSAMNTGITQALTDLKRHAATSRTGASWSLIGPQSTPTGGGNGRINAVRVQPSTGYLFACSPAGGLFRSTDGGSSWSAMSDAIAVMGATDVAFDPSNNNTMYLATGDGEAGDAYTTGIYKSTDGGNSWSQTGLTLAASAKKTISKILINPVNGNILIGGGVGIYLSTNGGSSWTQVSTSAVRDLEFKANDPLIVLAGGYASTPVLRSTNGGTTWAASGTGIPTSGWQRVALAVTPLDPTYVYALVSNSADDGLLGIYLSTDAGLTFTAKYVAPTVPTAAKPNTLGWNTNGADAGGQGWYDLSLAVDPSVKTTIYTGGVNLWKSTTSGATWTLNGQWEGIGAPYVHADIHDLTFVGTTLYAGTDGGISASSNGGTAWANKGGNLPIAQIYSMGISQTNPNLIISGHQDNGTNLTTDGSSWAEVDGGDGMVCFIDRTDNTRMFSEYYNGSISRSTNSGATWTPLTAIPGGSWVTPWMQDPVTTNTLYAGGTNVYRSTNSGTSFSSISSSLSVGVIITLDVAKSNNQNIVAASTTGIMRTLNGGTSWTNITAGLPSGVSITSAYFDPTDATKIYVGLASYSGQSVYYSANSGATWTNISSGLPSVPVNCFVIQNNSGDLYCGTDIGVYLRSAGTTNWVNYTAGMPGIVVKDLEIYAATGKLRAATFARGIWETPVNSNNQPPSVAITSPANNATISSGTNLVINGTANDPDGSVTRVEFYQGTTLLGTSTTAPYTFTWANVPTGSYVLTIKAFDDLNAIGTSTTVNINVAVGNDAGVPTVISPSGTVSTTSVTPSITLKNFGLTTLTATTISYKLDNAPLSTFNWTGNLATGASATVTLPTLTGYSVGAHTFYAQSGLVNSNPDANTPNDGVTSNFTYTVPPACANAVPSPYTQDFNAAASLPTGWVNTSNWLFGATHGNTGNGIYKNLYPSVPTGQFDIVGIGPLATADLLTFDYRVLTYVASGTYPANSPAATAGWGNLQIQVSTNCGSTFTTIHTINDANHIVQKPFANKTISLAAYAGQVVVIRLLGTQAAGGWWADFDNFNVGSQTIPVELMSFNAFSEENHNKIEWTTASEKELKIFQVERSTGNNDWEIVGTTTPKGGKKETTYSLDDNQPSLLNYYRLRTIELNGKEDVSKIVAVKRFDAKKLALLNVAPIPTSTGVTVDFSVNKEARIRLVLTNIVGQTVEATTIKAEEGTNKTFLNLSNLPNGTYILTVSDGETRAIKRIVKQ
jgi:Bacterial Ig domain/Secretion system C-terminal sorting domain/Sortilin, neurotensin receptor 3,